MHVPIFMRHRLKGNLIENVLGIYTYVTEALELVVHISAMLSKTSKRIHSFPKATSACWLVYTADPVTYYDSVIRSVIE